LATINEIRKGWRTDTFNKVIADESMKSDDEGRCFSIIYKNNAKSLDLMAQSEEIRDAWVKGLQLLADQIHGSNRESVYDQ
jgi:hypothetical protein